jgi:hypothetical protein
MALITLEEADQHLRLDLSDGGSPYATTDARAAEVQRTIEHASAVTLDYLKTPDAEYDPDTVPFVIKAACLLILAALWEHRGDVSYDPISPAVVSLLMRSRDPAIA